MKIGFGLIGAGNLGLSIASCLDKTIGRITGVCDKSEVAQRKAVMILECPVLNLEDLAKSSDVLLLAVPDAEIESVNRLLPDTQTETTLLVHFSGVLTSKVFGDSPIRLSAHPAKSFPCPITGEDTFKNVIFALEGTDCAITIFEPILDSIGAEYFNLTPESKPIYHTACVMASNLTLGLLESAARLSEKAGTSREILNRCMLELSRGTILNAQSSESIAHALSGPIERGDTATVALHLKALERFPAQRKLYRMLSQWVLELARGKGLAKSKAQEIEKLLLG